jgi:hypothetical protein
VARRPGRHCRRGLGGLAGGRRAHVPLAPIRGRASRLEARNGAAGLALGFAPTRRLTVWTEGDAQFQQGSSGAPAYTVVNETSIEVYRGVWLKFSPQLNTLPGDTSGGVFRMAFGLSLFPRTHWNVDLSHYRDRDRVDDVVTQTTLLQLHLYL